VVLSHLRPKCLSVLVLIIHDSKSSGNLGKGVTDVTFCDFYAWWILCPWIWPDSP
jgi:hypothetical protein